MEKNENFIGGNRAFDSQLINLINALHSRWHNYYAADTA